MHYLFLLAIVTVILTWTFFLRSDEFDAGLAAARHGKTEEALAAFSYIIDRSDSSGDNLARALNNRAVLHARTGDWPRALEDLEAAMRRDSDVMTISRNLAAVARIKAAADAGDLSAAVAAGYSTADLELIERKRLLGVY